jgi:hypothetical protein
MRHVLNLFPLCIALLTAACASPTASSQQASNQPTSMQSPDPQPNPTSDNSCGAVTADGECYGTIQRVCGANNMLVDVECANTNGYICRLVDGKAQCVDGTTQPTNPACGDVPALGVCNGTKMQWCDSGVLRDTDCAYDIGSTCEMINGEAKCVAG